MTAGKTLINICALCMITLFLSGCSETQFVSHWAKKITWPGQTENAGTYKVGKPYRVGSVWYRPTEDFTLVETGIASWYGPDFHGKRTANGERYDQNELTAAHRTLQMPSLVRVTNLDNGRSVVVRINDRGPFKHGRVIDVSKRSAELLGFIGRGTARVKIEVLTRESRQMAEAARRGMDTSRLTVADLNRLEQQRPPSSPQPAVITSREPLVEREQIASRDYDSDGLPESLQTPTITVEELSAPSGARSSRAPEPISLEPRPLTNTTLGQDEQFATPSGLAPGRMEEGHFMPAPVVQQERVSRTALFVQAGAFAVRENADRLKRNLEGIAPVRIDTVRASSGKTLYRVKLGPMDSISKADMALERVVALGNRSARVVRED